MKTLQRKAAGAKGGFSLAELMVVIVIIGLLATLVVPSVIDKLKTASTGVAKTDIMTINSALTSYVVENGGRYPESLEALVTPDESGRTYLDMETIPLDPWKNEYQYEPPGSGSTKPDVYSLGADGAIGGEGDDRDIHLQDIKNKEI